MKRIAPILFLMLYSCGYDRFEGMEAGDIAGDETIANCSIGALKRNYFGTPTVIHDRMVISGYVTANDRSGNWYQSIVIDDGTGAIEIRAGVPDMHNRYQLGRRVVADVQGLALGEYNGVLQLGYKINSYSDWRVEGFGTDFIFGRYVCRDTAFSEVVPLDKNISQLDVSDCGRLVRIGKVLAVDDERSLAWANVGQGGVKPQTGVRTFVDASGETIKVLTSGYAKFAHEKIPSDSVYLTGVLLHGAFDGGRERFGLRLRELYDVEED